MEGSQESASLFGKSKRKPSLHEAEQEVWGVGKIGYNCCLGKINLKSPFLFLRKVCHLEIAGSWIGRAVTSLCRPPLSHIIACIKKLIFEEAFERYIQGVSKKLSFVK